MQEFPYKHSKLRHFAYLLRYEILKIIHRKVRKETYLEINVRANFIKQKLYYRATSIDVILGAYNITDNSESTRQRQTSTNYTNHPDWNPQNLTNDIALVYLSIPVELNENVKIINLTFDEDTFENQDGK